MSADSQTLDQLYTQVKELSFDDRLRLVQRIVQTLVAPIPQHDPQPLQFGEFGGDEASMATLEDFALAQWRPTDEELDGP